MPAFSLLEDLSLEARELCEVFSGELEQIFGDTLYGIYLHGAAVFPCSGAIHDLDLHVIVEGLGTASRGV